MRTMLGMAALAVVFVAAGAEAQRPARRQQAIEIRGQVPTPQVVTVRPREVPAYSRQVLVPNFYDHDFWPSIVQPYQMVPQRMITGTAVPDSTRRRLTPGDSAQARPTGTTSADTTGRASGTPPARAPRE